MRLLPSKSLARSLRSNAGLEAALTIGVLPHRVLVSEVGAKSLGRYCFVGLSETFGPCRCGIFRRLSWDRHTQKRDNQGESEEGFCIHHVGLLVKTERPSAEHPVDMRRAESQSGFLLARL